MNVSHAALQPRVTSGYTCDSWGVTQNEVGAVDVVDGTDCTPGSVTIHRRVGFYCHVLAQYVEPVHIDAVVDQFLHRHVDLVAALHPDDYSRVVRWADGSAVETELRVDVEFAEGSLSPSAHRGLQQVLPGQSRDKDRWHASTQLVPPAQHRPEQSLLHETHGERLVIACPERGRGTAKIDVSLQRNAGDSRACPRHHMGASQFRSKLDQLLWRLEVDQATLELLRRETDW